ncbi:peptidoglycan bridge formation glycyltransferase FemA/FemB family protein [Winogradskyella psychrotolerans]|uniref:peptidoglycan bridge formation glycyltransferase FemA/FemB family protein n=1 Tax=Winogradskyella psychrotolerans TaxID=1344585 RepID=UPI001C06609C|nr:peptidoglycan bridge formation glycyltransferase FemA/FemB family protein [Winogradskyella psychrotolerans]MBU2921211.1 peptidoglycan bridge formation glycyltransferase FemA/FemB family protein [Winogradskyella psychrotolerans]
MMKEITNKKEWNAILEQIENYDFYHTYDYHNISKNEDETPILLTYTKDKATIALPILLRKIPNTIYSDLTSVYGYAGPLCNVDVNMYDFNDFKTTFNAYLDSNNIVSVFSRLHPYIQQDRILENLGDTVSLGDVVNIDVSLPIEQSRMAYGKSNKNQINKLRKQCEVVKAETKEEILEFVDIYYENMKRLNAKKNYFFSKEYFLNFMEISDFDTDILLVRHLESNTFVAGSMFVKTKQIVQYHLSGTRTEHLRLKPSKLFLDEMRLQATEQGFKVFNLGGGLGSEHDSLFEFKASFSKDFKTFKVWKYIVNQDIYDELSQQKDETDFFPKYRS